MKKNPDFISVAQKVFDKNFSDAACGFIAGSILRDQATETSDIDLIVLYADETHETYRDSMISDGWPVEIFVHNIKSQQYFFDKDIINGHASTLSMILDGTLIGSQQIVGMKQKNLAKQLLEQGPKKWTSEKIDWQRYSITDLWDDVRATHDPDAVTAVLAELYPKIGEFYLRSQNKWSGKGKALVRLLKQNDPTFAEDFINAFDMAFNAKELHLLEKLIDQLLASHGGKLFAGYKSVAVDW